MLISALALAWRWRPGGALRHGGDVCCRRASQRADPGPTVAPCHGCCGRRGVTARAGQERSAGSGVQDRDSRPPGWYSNQGYHTQKAPKHPPRSARPCRYCVRMGFAPSFFRRAPARPRLARSLRHLAREVDERWPDRPTASDGWIGDDPHSQRVSDHNPDSDGIVHALDVTCRGATAGAIIGAALAHPSTHYVIHAGSIWSRRLDFSPRPYTGPDPHSTHVHVSIRHSNRAERSRARWLPS